jgi:hypothetical protein
MRRAGHIAKCMSARPAARLRMLTGKSKTNAFGGKFEAGTKPVDIAIVESKPENQQSTIDAVTRAVVRGQQEAAAFGGKEVD